MQLFSKLWLAVIFAGMTAFTPLHGQNVSDEQKIKQTINAFFQALSDVDMVKLKSYCKPGFIVLESGEIWPLDTLEAKMKPFIGRGIKRVNTIDFKQVVIEGDVAWVTYLNRADFAKGEMKSTVNWLESAVLNRSAGTWKVAMLHSTTLPKKE